MITRYPGGTLVPKGNAHLIACNFGWTIRNRSIDWHLIKTTLPLSPPGLVSTLRSLPFVAVICAILDGEGIEHQCSSEGKSGKILSA